MFKFIYELKAKLQERISEKGQGMTEYAIILAVVAVVAVAVFMNGDNGLQNSVKGAYTKTSNAINDINVGDTTTTPAPSGT